MMNTIVELKKIRILRLKSSGIVLADILNVCHLSARSSSMNREKCISSSVIKASLFLPLMFSCMNVFSVESGIYAKAGTLGVGAGIGFSLTDSINLRIGYTALNFDKDIEQTDVTYDGDIKLGGGELLVDWHPSNSSFRITGGVYISRNHVDATAKPEGSFYEIDGDIYNVNEIGRLKGDVELDDIAPYLGIGWGNVLSKEKGFSFMADIGVQYNGKPKVDLDLTCGEVLTAFPGRCEELRSDVRAEERDLEDDISDYRWWPVLNIGFAYRF
jgi:hypothetical protein